MYQNILVPLDGSKLAECALPHLKTLFKDGVMGKVTLLNVFTVPIQGSGQYPGVDHIQAVRKSLLMESENYLTKAESLLEAEGIKVKKESMEGNRPAEIISEYAQKNGIDLIVIATHGYTGLKKLMFGSVALGVLHESRIPVLLIRPQSCQM